MKEIVKSAVAAAAAGEYVVLVVDSSRVIGALMDVYDEARLFGNARSSRGMRLCLVGDGSVKVVGVEHADYAIRGRECTVYTYPEWLALGLSSAPRESG